MGVTGYDHLMTDYSPRGAAQRAQAAREVLRQLDAAEGNAAPGDLDDVDAVTLAAMRERLGLELRLYAAGEHERDLNGAASTVGSRSCSPAAYGRSSSPRRSRIAARVTAAPPSMCPGAALPSAASHWRHTSPR